MNSIERFLALCVYGWGTVKALVADRIMECFYPAMWQFTLNTRARTVHVVKAVDKTVQSSRR